MTSQCASAETQKKYRKSLTNISKISFGSEISSREHNKRVFQCFNIIPSEKYSKYGQMKNPKSTPSHVAVVVRRNLRRRMNCENFSQFFFCLFRSSIDIIYPSWWCERVNPFKISRSMLSQRVNKKQKSIFGVLERCFAMRMSLTQLSSEMRRL